MTPEDVSKMDQGFAVMAETLPTYLYRLYKNCLGEGFNEHQAMRIVIQSVANLRPSS